MKDAFNFYYFRGEYKMSLAKSELSSTQMQKILLSDKTVCCNFLVFTVVTLMSCIYTFIMGVHFIGFCTFLIAKFGGKMLAIAMSRISASVKLLIYTLGQFQSSTFW
ncbi:hypothetical protein Anas_02485 [Armadillidium nasatum]|uniref:Uncharacterized protein n=1 Tax=Armadillidium nasatum TaxID=96803 RepID=A0A5N5TGV1_9CRUS|nr:hypothetical protein Anas_02485 [Armadillidium nasatum]